MISEKIKNLPKKYIYGVLAVVLLLVVLYFVFSKMGGQSDTNDGIATFPTSTAVTSSTMVVPKKSSSQANAPLSATQKYLDAIRVYKNVGYYFQFVECHGAPGTLTLKKGKKFMLDNRDAKAHKLAVQGGQTFQVKAYDFAIATAPSTVGIHYITCDGGGAASITVQN